MTQYLEFEKPLAEIEGKANELRAMALETPEAEVGNIHRLQATGTLRTTTP